jgi:hypothetical protein
MQVKLGKIFYIRPLFKVRFIQDSVSSEFSLDMFRCKYVL